MSFFNTLPERAVFQSPRSGKFVSDEIEDVKKMLGMGNMFQSPRSGKFVSDDEITQEILDMLGISFNPLDRGNLYLIEFIRCVYHE